MKLRTIVLFFAIATAFSSCKDKSTLLARTWMLEDLRYTKEIPAEMKETIDQSVASLRQSFRLTYNADGSYSTTMQQQTLKGKWKLNWNGSVLTATTERGETKQYKILELTKEKFSFQAEEGGEQVIFDMVAEKKAE